MDEPEDVRLQQELFARLARPGHVVTTREAIALMDQDPELAQINGHLVHKAGNLRSVALDANIKPRKGEATENGATEERRGRNGERRKQ